MLNEIDKAVSELMEEGSDPDVIFHRVMETMGSVIAAAFAVNIDEVAVLLANRDEAIFRFAYPRNLYKAGMNTFPVSSASIAGRTFRAKKGQAYNDVPDVRHLGVYERIRSADGRAMYIQKMISAPMILPDEKPIGIIQVSRKGKTPEEAGPDFTDADLARLGEACREIAVRISGMIPEEFLS